MNLLRHPDSSLFPSRLLAPFLQMHPLETTFLAVRDADGLVSGRFDRASFRTSKLSVPLLTLWDSNGRQRQGSDYQSDHSVHRLIYLSAHRYLVPAVEGD